MGTYGPSYSATAGTSTTDITALTDGSVVALHGHFPTVARTTGQTLVAEKNNLVAGAAASVTLPTAVAGMRLMVSFAGSTSLTIQAPAGVTIGNSSVAGTLVFGEANEAGWANVTLQAISTTAWIIVSKEGTLYAT